jgi:hypothetical protein
MFLHLFEQAAIAAPTGGQVPKTCKKSPERLHQRSSIRTIGSCPHRTFSGIEKYLLVSNRNMPHYLLESNRNAPTRRNPTQMARINSARA